MRSRRSAGSEIEGAESVSVTCYYAIDDDEYPDERGEFEDTIWTRLLTCSMEAEIVAEYIILRNGFEIHEGRKFKVMMFADRNPETKPAWVVNVIVSVRPHLDLQAERGDQ